MNTGGSRSGAQNQPRGRLTGAVVFLCLPLLTGHALAQEGHTPAVLKLKETSFFYRTRVAPFTCLELERRVASLMSALGARNDIDVDVSGCDSSVAPLEPADISQSGSGSGRWGTAHNRWETAADPFSRTQRNAYEQTSHVRIRMMIPVEVTPEILAEMEKDKSRRELISRVTGNPAASFDDPIVFPAERREVTLSRRTVDLEADECELLEQMSASLFRELKMRVVQPGPRCSRDSISRMPPNMVVEALMPIFPTAPQVGPAPGEPVEEVSDAGAEDDGAGGSPAAEGSEAEAPAASEPKPE